MELRIITGRACTGKTALLLKKISELTNAGKQCLLIVPDAATYDAERLLMRERGGILGVEALGFTRLARRVLDETGGLAKNYISDDGRRMIMRYLIRENAEKLRLYGAEPVSAGEAEKLDELICAFKYGSSSPQALQTAAAELEKTDQPLADKLRDCAVLYSAREAFFAERGLQDSVDIRSELIKRVKESESLKKTYVFVDALHSFMNSNQLFEILTELMKHCPRVTVTLCTDENGGAAFAGDNALLERFCAAAEKNEIPCSVTRLEGYRADAPQGIKTIESELFSQAESSSEDASGVTLFRAANQRAELEMAFSHILGLISRGAKYSDIAVAAGGGESAVAELCQTLRDNGVSCFMDEARPLSSHPVSESLLAVLSAALRCKWSNEDENQNENEPIFMQEDVLRAAKSAFSPLRSARECVFEDYVLRYGVKGAEFGREFTRGAGEFSGLAVAEQARVALMKPLAALAIALRKADTAVECARALYDYMGEVKLYERLEKCGEWYAKNGQGDVSSEYKQVYAAILRLLDQIALIIGGKMNAARFCDVFEEGLAAHKTGVIPQDADAILLGGVRRISMREAKYKLVLSCADGLVPENSPDDGIINDRDTARLLTAGVDVFKQSAERAAESIRDVYACFSHATGGLYVSCALAADEGGAREPSEVFLRLERLFPNAKKPDGSYQSVKSGFVLLLDDLRALADGKNAAANLAPRYAFYAADERYAKRLADCVCRLFERPRGFEQSLARALIGQSEKTDVTRLESFNQCPFKYLVQYGLRPYVRREYEITPIDEGVYCHRALELFFSDFIERDKAKSADESGQKPRETEAEIESAIELTLQKTDSEQYRSGLLNAGEKNRAKKNRLHRQVRRAIKAAVEQIYSGDYLPILAEARLGAGGAAVPALDITLQNGKTLKFTGKLDRVDEKDGQVRIIDYKTGGESFEYEKLYAGLKLQLPMYARALSKWKKGCTGMFYMSLRESEDGDVKKYRLNGVLRGDQEIVESMDRVTKSGFSSVIPARFTKDGATGEALLEGAELERVMDFAVSKAAETASRIFCGENEPNPAAPEGSNACAFCDFASVCRYEASRSAPAPFPKMTKTTFFAALEQK